MNRADCQRLAIDRLHSAQTLLHSGYWSASYYLAGYSVELGLKSCIVRRLADEPEILFQRGGRKFAEECWTHDFEKLLKHANLKIHLDTKITSNPIFGSYWLLAIKWSESSRYEDKFEAEARSLYEAISDPSNGVLAWIQAHW